jgi:hypothetical protein
MMNLKEFSLARFLSQYMPRRTVEKIKENPQSENPTPQPTFKPSTSSIQAYSNTSTPNHSVSRTVNLTSTKDTTYKM